MIFQEYFFNSTFTRVIKLGGQIDDFHHIYAIYLIFNNQFDLLASKYNFLKFQRQVGFLTRKVFQNIDPQIALLFV